MKIVELTSKEMAIDEGFKMHGLYDYPISCLRCEKNISAIPNQNGLFKCECRFILLSYPCGVHIN